MTEAAPRVVRGDAISLIEAIYSLLPETGSVEVQRDSPFLAHDSHSHSHDETLLVVEGVITFSYGESAEECRSGDRLELPALTPHSSVASQEGCLYLIAVH